MEAKQGIDYWLRGFARTCRTFWPLRHCQSKPTGYKDMESEPSAELDFVTLL
jgi:hypothetical protein